MHTVGACLYAGMPLIYMMPPLLIQLYLIGSCGYVKRPSFSIVFYRRFLSAFLSAFSIST